MIPDLFGRYQSDMHGLRKYSLNAGLFLAVFAASLAACQPQVVEVEVTRIVTETETVIEEVQVEPIEVQATEGVKEVLEAEPEPVEATGSEEDGGSPFGPTAGQRAKIVPTRIASAGWVEAEAVAGSDPMRRLIEENPDQVVIIHQLETAGGRSTLMISAEGWVYSQALTTLPAIEPVEGAVAADLGAEINRFESSDELVELAAQQTCTACSSGGTLETVAILWPTSGLTIQMDQGTLIQPMTNLLNEIRTLHANQTRQATLRAFRLGEWTLR